MERKLFTKQSNCEQENLSQLFMELSPEQAAIIEGGLQRVQLLQLRSIKSGADFDGSDEVFAVINGQRIDFGFPQSMRTGSVANYTPAANVSGSSATVSLFDKDGSNQANADFLGSFTVRSSTRSPQIVSGSGSTYEVSFTAF